MSILAYNENNYYKTYYNRFNKGTYNVDVSTTGIQNIELNKYFKYEFI